MNKLVLPICLLVSQTATADHVPGHAKLEWGVGLVMLSAPDYIGSSYTQNALLPFPYLKYRGKYLRIDDGVEARFFDTPGLLLSISGNGSLPSPEDSPLREGMKRLDAGFELGPSLEYRLTHDEDTSVWLEVPLRFAFSVGKNSGYVGEVFNPKIAWRKAALGKYDWKLGVSAGPVFADRKFTSYYYGVQPQEATPQRESYISESGYTGFRTDFAFSKRIGEYWLGGFIRHDNLQNSVIQNSPLVTESTSWTAGISMAWVISDH